MKLTNSLLSIIAILLAVNAYFTYRSALVYEKKPVPAMTSEEFTKCLHGEAQGTGQFDCPYEWHLKGQ